MPSTRSRDPDPKMGARWLCWLCLWVCVAVPASAAPQVRETLFSATIDRSVLNRFRVYVDGPDALIYILNNGAVPEQVLDGRKGQPWRGSAASLGGMRLVYNYDPGLEAPTSYLSRLGCQVWSVCTGLEGTSAVVMMRQHSATEVRFRVLDFSELFDSLELALAGRAHEAPNNLTPIEVAALEEVAANSLRPRLRDALRSIASLERFEVLERSRWLTLLRNTRVLLHSDGHADPLQREVNRAQCRSLVMPLRPLIAQGQVEAVRMLAPVLHACRAEYIHIVDWFLDAPEDQRRAMAGPMLQVGGSRSDENLRQLGAFLAGLGGLRSPDQPKAAPPVRAPSAPLNNTRTKPPSPGGPPPNPADQRPDQPPRTAEVREIDPAARDEAVELAAISAVPNQIVLLAFNESDGLVRADSASLSGTVFRASVVEGGIANGVFRIEAMNGASSAVRMRAGSYRVKLNVKLFVARADRCIHPVFCLTRSKETRSSRNLVERTDFFLRPANGFRDVQIVKFGPLRPLDLDESSIYRSDLTEVRLVIELDGRIAPK